MSQNKSSRNLLLILIILNSGMIFFLSSGKSLFYEDNIKISFILAIIFCSIMAYRKETKKLEPKTQENPFAQDEINKILTSPKPLLALLFLSTLSTTYLIFSKRAAEQGLALGVSITVNVITILILIILEKKKHH